MTKLYLEKLIEMTKEELGRKIKIIREIRNYSQSYMADMIDTSQSHYSKIERGLIDISMGTLQKVIDVLQIGLIEILRFNPDQMLEEAVVTTNIPEEYGYKINRKEGKVDLIIDHYRSKSNAFSALF